MSFGRLFAFFCRCCTVILLFACLPTSDASAATEEARQQLQLTQNLLAGSRAQWTGDEKTMVDPAILERRIQDQDRIFNMMRAQVLYIETWEDGTTEKREATIQAYKDLTKDALEKTAFAALKNAKKMTEQVKKLPIGSKARAKLEALLKDKNFVAHLESIEKGAENAEEILGRVNQIADALSGDMDQLAAMKELAGEIPVLGDLIGYADLAAGYGNAFADTGSVLMDAAQITDLRQQLAINEKRWMSDDQAIRRTHQMLETLAQHGSRLAAYRYDDAISSGGLDSALDKQLDEIEAMLAATGVAKHQTAARNLKAQRLTAQDDQIARRKAEKERAEQQALADAAAADDAAIKAEQESHKFAQSWGASCAGWFPDFFFVPQSGGRRAAQIGVDNFNSPESRKQPRVAGGDAGLFNFNWGGSPVTSSEGKVLYTLYTFSVSPISQDVGTLLVATGGSRCEITANKVKVETEGTSKVVVGTIRGLDGVSRASTSPGPGDPLTVSIRVTGAAKMNKYKTAWSVRSGTLTGQSGFIREGGDWVARATIVPRRVPVLMDFKALLGDKEAITLSSYEIFGKMPSVERLLLLKSNGQELSPREELSIAIPNDREVAGINLRMEALLEGGQRVSPSSYGEGLDKVSLTIDRPDVALLSLPAGINSHDFGIAGQLAGRAVMTLRHRPDPRVGRTQELVQTYPVVVREFSIAAERQNNIDNLRLTALGPDQGMGTLRLRWIGAPPGQGGGQFSKIDGLWRSEAVPAANITAVEVMNAGGKLLTTLDVSSRLGDAAPATDRSTTSPSLKPGVTFKTVTNLSGHNPLFTSSPALNFGGQALSTVAQLVESARTGRASSGSSSACVKTVTMRTTVAGPPAIYSGNFNLSSTTLQCTTVPPGVGGAAEVFSITDAPGDAANTAYFVGSNPGPTSGWNYTTATYTAGNQVSFTATSTSGRQARITFRVTRNAAGANPSTLQIISIEALN